MTSNRDKYLQFYFHKKQSRATRMTTIVHWGPAKKNVKQKINKTMTKWNCKIPTRNGRKDRQTYEIKPQAIAVYNINIIFLFLVCPFLQHKVAELFKSSSQSPLKTIQPRNHSMYMNCCYFVDTKCPKLCKFFFHSLEYPKPLLSRCCC